MKSKPFDLKWLLGSFWPDWVGGILLALLNILLTAIYKPWGVTSAITDWGMRIWALLGGHPEKWVDYLKEADYNFLSKHPFFSEETILNLGVITGVLFASALAAQFRIKLPRGYRQLVLGLTGGILMGYGARLAAGCNIGAVVGGIASQSLHGWIAGIFLFFGALAGSIVLKYFFMRTR